MHSFSIFFHTFILHTSILQIYIIHISNLLINIPRDREKRWNKIRVFFSCVLNDYRDFFYLIVKKRIVIHFAIIWILILFPHQFSSGFAMSWTNCLPSTFPWYDRIGRSLFSRITSSSVNSSCIGRKDAKSPNSTRTRLPCLVLTSLKLDVWYSPISHWVQVMYFLLCKALLNLFKIDDMFEVDIFFLLLHDCLEWKYLINWIISVHRLRYLLLTISRCNPGESGRGNNGFFL